MFFLPVILLFLVFYFFLLGGLFFFLKIGLISLAFQRLGLPPDLVFALLLLSLVGSGLNIPLKRIQSENLLPEQVVEFFGWKFRIPAAADSQSTVLAVNLGGAVIPGLLSLYLIWRWFSLIVLFKVATAVVTVLVNRVARPVRGLGIATPALFPPLVAA
ncbi:MAG TPA: hypothetical protein DCR87_01715, partial [Acidobacteria bacterium]|nr:hypothetical protein [Acidobacteriota bacterium]